MNIKPSLEVIFLANGKDAALDVVREGEKGVQHAFNIKTGKYSERCEAEGILFSWRL